MKLAALHIIILSIAFAYPGHACRGLFSEVQTYLDALPPEANTKAIVAKVELISAPETRVNGMLSIRIRVLEAIKGASSHQEFVVLSHTHSCARDDKVKQGEKYYIAGELNSQGEFVGDWVGLDFQTYWTKRMQKN